MTKTCRRGALISLALSALVCPTVCTAQELFFHGVPSVKAECDAHGCARIGLSAAEAQEHVVRVTREDGQLLWASRGERTLIRVSSGIYEDLIDPAGGGFVKIERGLDETVSYMEYLTIGLSSITYWGKGQ